MSVLPFLLNKGTNNDLSNYRTGAAQDSLTESRSLLGDFARGLREVLSFDGATAGSRVYWTLGAAGNVQGSPKTLGGVLRFPTSQANTNRGLWTLSDSPGGGMTSGKTLAMHSYGADLYLRFYDGGAANYRQVRYVNAVATNLGLWTAWALTHDGTATAPILYLNGQAFAGIESTTGSPGAWSSILNTSYLVQGVSVATELVPPSRQLPLTLINAVLSATEVLEWTQTGRLPAWCEIGVGSMVNRFPSSVANLSINVADGTAFSNSGNYGQYWGVNSTNTSISVSGQVLTMSRLNGTAGIFSGSVLNSGNAPRKKYRLTLYVSAMTGSWAVYEDGNGNTQYPLSIGLNVIEFFAADGTMRIYGNSVGGSITIDATTQPFVLQDLGPVVKPIVQPIPVLADAGANRIPGVVTSGVLPLTEKRDWLIQATTNTLGNQQLLGANVFTDYTRHSIDSWDIKTAGTPTVYCGSSSGGNGYVTSGALAARVNPLTLVKRYADANAMWANSTTTDPLYHTIRGHLAD